MTGLSYQAIKERLTDCECDSLIYPWYEHTVFRGKSYGLAESGYDIRIKQRVELYPRNARTWLYNKLIAPFTGKRRDFKVLASAIEHIRLPPDIRASIADKSSNVRNWITLQNTRAEPGWYGFLTLEIIYHGDVPLVIEAGEPIAQLVFEFLDAPTERPYVGKYQAQPDRPVAALKEKISDL